MMSTPRAKYASLLVDGGRWTYGRARQNNEGITCGMLFLRCGFQPAQTSRSSQTARVFAKRVSLLMYRSFAIYTTGRGRCHSSLNARQNARSGSWCSTGDRHAHPFRRDGTWQWSTTNSNPTDDISSPDRLDAQLVHLLEDILLLTKLA